MKKTLFLLFAMIWSMSMYSQDEAALDSIALAEVVVSSGVIDVAKERETPIAVSTITAREVQLKVGNMEFPEIMNKTPGVYATKQGGGYGDSRISLRGFDQRNTSFLIKLLFGRFLLFCSLKSSFGMPLILIICFKPQSS